MSYTKLICFDFDGVIHSYKSAWKEAGHIPDPPVSGALNFLLECLQAGHRVAIYSSRSHEPGGIDAMKAWLWYWTEQEWTWEKGEHGLEHKLMIRDKIEWPTVKPPAFITIDDRVICFTGIWPDLKQIEEFKPWNK